MDKKENNISLNDLSRIRKIINLVINILEESINNYSDDTLISEKNKKLINFLMGNKENVVSIITKLTNLLIKVIPLEEKMNNNNISQEEKLSDEDMEMLMRYIDKCNFIFNKKQHYNHK